MNRMEILNVLSDHKDELVRNFGVAAIGIFGSYARGEQRSDSDVDVLFSTSMTVFTLIDYASLKEYLEQILKMRVDLVKIEALDKKPRIKANILEELQYAQGF